MAPTDEALVAEIAGASDRVVQLSNVEDVSIALRGAILATDNAICRLQERLSQPPSGGWDDAAVERAIAAFIEAEVARPVRIVPPAKFTEEDARESRRSVLRATINWPTSMRAALNAAAPKAPGGELEDTSNGSE